VDFPRKLLQCKTSRKYHVCGNSGLSRFYLCDLSRRSERRITPPASQLLETPGFSQLLFPAFPQSHNPATQPMTATPSGRRSTAAVLSQLSTLANSAVPVSGLLPAAFLQNPQRRILPQTCDPSGRPPNCR